MLKDRKFNGARLQASRKYRGMTIIELAESIGVSKQAISQYEGGQSSPLFEVLIKIANTLGFPIDYFYEEDKINIKLGNTYFRALSKMSKKEENAQKEKTKLIGKLFYFLNEYIEFPSLNLPVFEEDLSIEEKALKLREYWGLGEEPIKDVIYLLEKNGVIVSESTTDSNNIDAFSQQQNINGEKRYVVVLGNDKFSSTRRQFSAAHELGHIILHDGFLELDTMSKEEIRNMENEAHSFAASFLLPKNAFSEDVNLYPTSLEYYKELKKKWRTSISAMLVRANQLNILSYSSYQSLIKKMGRLGWRIKEPLDDTLLVNRPTVLRSAIDILLDNDILDESEIIKELSSLGLSLAREEVEELLGLDKGRLRPKKSHVEVIDMQIKRDNKNKIAE
ncbi:XRE family transcriptional regulator [Clostridium cadaveris]|uniref:helix-turn-helix domain-containing protein n=1 Tax=Clostridium cadaveris TaxID=1529 RepID=UPI0031DD3178